MTTYYYDSYAIIEFLVKNEKYRKYFTEHAGILTMLNLMEVSYALLKHLHAKSTINDLEAFLPYVTGFEVADVDAAMKMRLKLEREKKLNISYVDALGYHLARKHGVKFLTGDEHFKTLDNVEFVK
jgi:predicted nucleic acid-binding protein